MSRTFKSHSFLLYSSDWKSGLLHVGDMRRDLMTNHSKGVASRMCDVKIHEQDAVDIWHWTSYEWSFISE